MGGGRKMKTIKLSNKKFDKLEKFIEIDTDLLERLMILLDDIDEVTDISGDMNSKDLLFEIKIIFDEYNK